MPNFLPIQLEAERENELLEIVAKEAAQEVDDFVTWLLDNGIPTNMNMPPAERLALYTRLTDPRDFPYIMDPNYLDLFEQKRVPALVSPRWLNVMAVPEFFRAMATDFRNVYRTQVLDKMKA